MADESASAQASWLRPLPVCAFISPIIAAPSGRGLVPVLLIIGMWALLDMFSGPRRHELKSIPVRPLFFWVIATFCLVTGSALWAAVPAQSVEVGLSFAGLAVFGLVLMRYAVNQPAAEMESTRTALVAGVSTALVLLAIGAGYGITTGQPMWGKEGQHPLGTLSHAQTVLSVLIIPAIAILWDRGRIGRIYALCLFAFFGMTYFHLVHGASTLAVIAAAAAYVLVRFLGVRCLMVLCAIVALALLLMPVLLGFALPDRAGLVGMTPERGPWPSELHRLYMWRFVIDTISDSNILIGFGADASRGFPGANEKIMWGIELMPLHPHNGALQIWLELGVLGVVLMTLLPIIIYWSSRTLPRAECALIAALLTAYLVPWLVSYGVWQSWWVALAWLTACIGRGLASSKTEVV